MKLPAGLEIEAEKIRGGKVDREVLADGKLILSGYLPAPLAERFTRAWAAMSGQRMDWCYQAGWMHILAIGDLEQVEWARPFMMAVYRLMEKEQ